MNNNLWQACKQLTCVISADGRFHDCFHPVTDDRLLIGTEVMGLVVIMFDTETIAARIHILIVRNLVANYVDESLDFCFLRCCYQYISLFRKKDASVRSCGCSSTNINDLP